MFSENRKEGRWELPRRMRVLAIFGSARVDLREALVQPGLSVIEVLTVFGNIEVIVPPDIIVECDGDAFLASFTMERSRRGAGASPPPIDAPVVRVSGNAYAAAVTIQIRGRKDRAQGKLRRKLELEG